MADEMKPTGIDEIISKLTAFQDSHMKKIDKQLKNIEILAKSVKDLRLGVQTSDAKVENSLWEAPKFSTDTQLVATDGRYNQSPYLNSGSDTNRQFKSMRPEATRFSGENPSAWISQMQRYFDYYDTPDQRRLIIASFYLDGGALYWYDWMQKYHLLSSWNDFLLAIMKRFGTDNHESSFENFKLMPTGSLEESHHLFDHLSEYLIKDPVIVEPSSLAVELRFASRTNIHEYELVQQNTLVDKFDSFKNLDEAAGVGIAVKQECEGFEKVQAEKDFGDDGAIEVREEIHEMEFTDTEKRSGNNLTTNCLVVSADVYISSEITSIIEGKSHFSENFTFSTIKMDEVDSIEWQLRADKRTVVRKNLLAVSWRRLNLELIQRYSGRKAVNLYELLASIGMRLLLDAWEEQYLRCFVYESPTRWFNFLPWAELCYNTSFHSAILMSPFEAVFGKSPPSLPSYILNSSSVEAVDHWLKDRDTILQSLRTNLERAQLKMKAQADKHRREVNFEVGQWCYVRLQPHRQSSVSGQRFTKLSKRFFGPFQILKRVGPVAYKLALPSHSKIHPIFHVSVLKGCPNPEAVDMLQLPSASVDNQPLLAPLAVLDMRRIKKDQSWISQVLVQWEGLPLEETSWEDISSFQHAYPAFHLEDKVLSNAEGNDTTASIKERVKSRRLKSIPKKLMDYVTSK